jgi:growth arrest-specific protein 8
LTKTYDQKVKSLGEELQLRLKVESHETKERKDQQINDLMKNHESAFGEMKNYYNDITRENLELIRMHREKSIDIRS